MIKNLLILSAIIIFLLISCKDDENLKPLIIISDTVNNLEVTLTGSVSDDDGKIISANINWGDNSSSIISKNSYNSFTENHIYSKNGTFAISVTATDDNNESSNQSITVDVNYPETSLEGIKETMYKTSDDEILILTLNLHTYQETNQDQKLKMIADVIALMDVDFVAFQECAQNKSSEILEETIRIDNTAYIISKKIENEHGVNYDFIWDWAHYGWDIYEEGVAILSKHTLLESESKYISTSTSTTNIESRKVIYGAYSIENIGQFNIFSVHTHWRTSETSEEQNNQIINIKNMVTEKEELFTGTNLISFVCGDFNCNPTSEFPWSEGYYTMVENGDYKDTFLEIYNNANTVPALSNYNTIGGDFPGRIDYIFMKMNPDFTIVDSQIIFTPAIVGTVSDHYGILTKIKFAL